MLQHVVQGRAQAGIDGVVVDPGGSSGDQRLGEQAQRRLAAAGAEVEHPHLEAHEAAVDGAHQRLGQQPALADAGLAAQMEKRPALRCRKHGGNLREFELATDERQAARRRGLAQAFETPQPLRCGNPLQAAPAKRRGAHPVGDGAPGRVIEHDLARLRLADDAGRQVHGLAQHGVVAPHTAADLTSHDLAQRDADMAEQRRRGRAAEIGRKRRHRPLDRIGGGDGAQGVVLVRQRRAEHGHGGIADVLVDRSAVLDDQLVGAGQEVVDDAAHLLSAERARKLGEAAEVGEQHGDLPAFRLGCGRRSRLLQADDRFEQPLAMAERSDTKLAQVIRRQATQHPAIDVIGDKSIRVLAKAQPFQPATNVHPRAPTPRSHPA